MNLPTYCPNCGHKSKKVSIEENDKAITIDCENCGVSTDMEATMLEKNEVASQKNEGYIFKAHIILNKQWPANFADQHLAPAWKCLLCGQYTLDKKNNLYHCGDCGATYDIEHE